MVTVMLIVGDVCHDRMAMDSRREATSGVLVMQYGSTEVTIVQPKKGSIVLLRGRAGDLCLLRVANAAIPRIGVPRRMEHVPLRPNQEASK
jgi:hypothetical protein